MGMLMVVLVPIYLLLLPGAMLYGWYRARQRKYSISKRALYALYGFLIVYLPVMWDWIPTIFTYNHYCKTQSGSWVYKTPEQWEKENPGVLETLKYIGEEIKLPTDKYDKFNRTFSYKDNDRFYTTSITEKVSDWLPIFKDATILYDSKDNSVIYKRVDFYSGYPSGLAGIFPEGEFVTGMKFWLVRRWCPFGSNQFNTRDTFNYGDQVRNYFSDGGKK